MRFTDGELQFIANAIRAARDLYAEDARNCRKEGATRLAQAFSLQVQRCDSLIERFAEEGYC